MFDPVKRKLSPKTSKLTLKTSTFHIGTYAGTCTADAPFKNRSKVFAKVFLKW